MGLWAHPHRGQQLQFFNALLYKLADICFEAPRGPVRTRHRHGCVGCIWTHRGAAHGHRKLSVSPVQGQGRSVQKVPERYAPGFLVGVETPQLFEALRLKKVTLLNSCQKWAHATLGTCTPLSKTSQTAPRGSFLSCARM